MLVAYGKEKREIVDKYLRLKPWYVGDLQKSIRAKHTIDYLNNKQPRDADDPILNRAEWSGEAFWEECLKADLKKLDLAYEKYFPKPTDDKFKYTWVGINPSIEYYPTMSALYKDLKSLNMKSQSYEAVVEGHTKEGYRPHIHMILHTHVKPYRIVKALSEHFHCASNFIEVKNMSQFYSEKQDYIRGKKKDDSKIPYVEKDREERERCSIPHLISYNMEKIKSLPTL